MDIQLNSKDLLDDTVAVVRDQEIESATIDAASTHAWDRIFEVLKLSSTPDFKIRACAEIQAILPQYKAGCLAEDHALIVRDHLAECLACQTQNSRISHGSRLARPNGDGQPTSLRYYFLAPARRELLVLGKFLAGIIAAIFFFGSGGHFRLSS